MSLEWRTIVEGGGTTSQPTVLSLKGLEIFQRIADLMSFCPQIELKDHQTNLGVTCGQHVKSRPCSRGSYSGPHIGLRSQFTGLHRIAHHRTSKKEIKHINTQTLPPKNPTTDPGIEYRACRSLDIESSGRTHKLNSNKNNTGNNYVPS